MKSQNHHCFSALSILALLWSISPTALHADVGSENTVIVVNADSWASLAVANQYIHLRQIPAKNVVYLNDLPHFEQVTVEQFREEILKPILKTIKQRGLAEQIDCIAYSSDLPYAVNVRGDIGDKKLPRIITPTAAINGLTYLYEQVLAKDINYLQLNANRYMRLPQSQFKAKPILPPEQKRLSEASALIAQKKWKEAEAIFRDIAKQHPKQSSVQYNLACCLARLDKADEAIAVLKQAVAVGWANDQHAATDPDLATIRKRDDFLALLKEMQKHTYDVQSTLGFHNRYQWSTRGEKVDVDGRRYLLSTMLAVTSGRGNSVREAIDSLRRSAAADATHPQGTFYFLTNGDIRAKTRQGAFRSAVGKLKTMGMRGEIVEGTLPQNKNDVLGAVVGRANFDWPKSKSTMLPGAISEHLTSLGGVMREKGGQTPLSEFIRNGAAGASGTVTEPFALQAKFPFPFLHVHYARGSTLVESFYQSVYGPYQLLIVGDPLCQPWEKAPTVIIDGVKSDEKVSGKVVITPQAVFPKGDSRSVLRFEFFVDGRLTGTCKKGETFSLDTLALADGHHQARIIAIANDDLETQGRIIVALVVDNRQRQVQLTSTLGEKITFGKTVLLRAEAPGAKHITLQHNGRSLATIDGGAGEAKIDSTQLGLGPVQVHAVAHYDDRQLSTAIGGPLQLQIISPSALAAQPLGEKVELAAGLLLTPANGESLVVEDTYPRDWLKKLNLEPDQAFTLQGVFEVAGEDIFQFQLSSNCNVEIRVDGKVLPQRNGGPWKLMPVALKPGTHRLELKGIAPKNPSLQIRFGNRGAQSLDAKRFRHVAGNN